jgi:hypothetical protein
MITSTAAAEHQTRQTMENEHRESLQTYAWKKEVYRKKIKLKSYGGRLSGVTAVSGLMATRLD